MKEADRLQRFRSFLGTPSNYPLIVSLGIMVAIVVLRVLAAIGIGGADDSLVLLGVLVAMALLVPTLLLEHPRQLSLVHDRIDQLSRDMDQTLALALQPTELSGFFKNRSFIKNYPQYCEGAREEVFAVGVTLAYFSIGHKDLVRDLVGKGCRMRFLLPSPEQDGVLRPLVEPLEAHFDEPQCRAVLRASINNFAGLRRDAAKRATNPLELRLYTSALPTLGLTVVDPKSPHAKMLVELYPYKCSQERRPSFELRRREDQGLFDVLLNHFEMLWQDSSPI